MSLSGKTRARVVLWIVSAGLMPLFTLAALACWQLLHGWLRVTGTAVFVGLDLAAGLFWLHFVYHHLETIESGGIR